MGDPDADRNDDEEGGRREERKRICLNHCLWGTFWLLDIGLVQYIILIIFMCLGGLFFFLIERDDQDLDYATSVYWAAITLSTVGYGEITPISSGGKVYTFFFALIGIPYFLFASSILWTAMARFAVWLAGVILRIDPLNPPPALSPWKCRFIDSAPFIFASVMFMCSLFLGGLFYVAAEVCCYCSFFSSFLYFFSLSSQGWTYLEAVYFCFITQTTIGYGDFFPSTTSARIFSIFYAVWNITCLGAIITAINAMYDNRTKTNRQRIRDHVEKRTGISLTQKKFTLEERDEEKEAVEKIWEGLNPVQKQLLLEKLSKTRTEKGSNVNHI